MGLPVATTTGSWGGEVEMEWRWSGDGVEADSSIAAAKEPSYDGSMTSAAWYQVEYIKHQIRRGVESNMVP